MQEFLFTPYIFFFVARFPSVSFSDFLLGEIFLVIAWPSPNVENVFYNNCLIARALIGSFLSSIRVSRDKISIYASFKVQLSAVRLSTF